MANSCLMEAQNFILADCTVNNESYNFDVDRSFKVSKL